MERMGELTDHVSTVAVFILQEMSQSYKDMCTLNDKVANIVGMLTEKMAQGQEASHGVDRWYGKLMK